MKTTIRAKLLAIQDEMYINYVFQNLDFPKNSKERYITVTKCPNWQYSQPLEIGDVGFLEYEHADADTLYYDVSSKTTQKYQYTADYFINFIKKNKTEDNVKEFKF